MQQQRFRKSELFRTGLENQLLPQAPRRPASRPFQGPVSCVLVHLSGALVWFFRWSVGWLVAKQTIFVLVNILPFTKYFPFLLLPSQRAVRFAHSPESSTLQLTALLRGRPNGIHADCSHCYSLHSGIFSLLCKHQIFKIRSPILGHFGNFQRFAIANNATANNRVRMCFCIARGVFLR